MADVFAYLEGFGVSGGSPNKSTIIVTAPTGSTVTCKMGSTTKTATEKNGVWTFGGLDLGTWTITSTKGGDSATQDVVITRLTVEYVTIVYRITPEFTYTGDYEIVDDSDNPISDFANWKGNWKIRFLTSGTLTFTNLNGAEGGIDVFLVGGGGDGGARNWNPDSNVQMHGAGGGGGHTKTQKNISVTVGTAYTITIGSNTGTTNAFGLSASGGTSAYGAAKGWENGGSGGSGGGATDGTGGTDGGNGTAPRHGVAGTGQGTTTREFGETNGRLYASGGNGDKTNPTVANSGNGADGRSTDDPSTSKNPGASGIVVIRNARGAA